MIFLSEEGEGMNIRYCILPLSNYQRDVIGASASEVVQREIRLI